MNSTIQNSSNMQVVVLTRVELGGAASIVQNIINGIPLKKDYMQQVRTVSSIVKSLAGMKRTPVPAGSSLVIIDSGIYVEEQEVYYKFHYATPPEESAEPITAENL